MMSKISPSDFQHFVESVLNETDKIAQHYFNNHGTIETKDDASPVTIADKEIERFIRDRIAQTYPEHGIIGEEGEDKSAQSPYCWVIDPIDGTKAFIAGKPTFTTLVGLMVDGVPTHGVVSQPVEQKRWSASDEYIPISNLPPIHPASPSLTHPAPSTLAHPAPSTLAHPARGGGKGGESPSGETIDRMIPATMPPLPSASRSPSTPQAGWIKNMHIATTSEGYFSQAQLNAIEQMKQEGADITYGGDAYPYMMLTEGKLDAAFDVGFQPHDIIPLLPILQQAGVWIGFFDEGQATDTITNNVVVARDAEVGQWLLEKLLV